MSNYIFWLAHRIPGMLTCPQCPIYNDNHDLVRKGRQSHKKNQQMFHKQISTLNSHIILPKPKFGSMDHYKILLH